MHSLLSVLIPAYNHEKYIAECVESVIEQDWPRMELIILDDGSKDGTWSRIGALERKALESGKFERIEVTTQENAGTCVTFNRLCEKARGDVIAIIASDDKYLPGAFAAMMKVLADDSRIGVVVGQSEIMDGEGRRCYWNARQQSVYEPEKARWQTFNDYLKEKTGVGTDDGDFGAYERLVRCNHIPNGYLIRANCLRQVLPFQRAAPLEDWWLHLQLSKVCRYKCIGDHTFSYRWHAGNTIRQEKRMAELSSRTVRWEVERTAKLADSKWHEMIVAAWSDRKRIWGFGSMLWDERVREIGRRYHVLHICGWRIRH